MVDEPSSNSPTIEVDEAAAYFGVTESSDVLHAMMAMPREQAMIQFFELLSDIVLRPGDFDFEAASERMQCEGGEIYYLVAGHLGLMSMPDPILQALGMPDSNGEASGSAVGSMDEQQREALTSMADPMRMMKLFAVAQQTGGSAEVQTYLSTLEGLLADVGSSIPALATVHRELDAALDVAGHVLPIASLASGAASAASVDVPETVALPEAPPEPEPEPAAALETTPSPSPAQDRVPLPGQAAVAAPPSEEPTESIPLPSALVALPDVAKEAEPEPVVNVENDREVARATQDAFAGAFSSQLEPKPVVQPPEPPAEPPEEEEFVSAAEHFIAADEDGSGALDVEELARATGTSIEEATELHAQADIDGDGVVSLSEFIASPAAEKTAGLPKPVAPVRRPLGQPGQAAAQPNPVQQRPQPLQPSSHPPMGQQPMQPQGWQQQPLQDPQSWQQQPMQPQGWQQPQRPLVQPTIRSGIHCRGCGIGLDPYWRFCPVCGQQNLGY